MASLWALLNRHGPVVLFSFAITGTPSSAGYSSFWEVSSSQ